MASRNGQKWHVRLAHKARVRGTGQGARLGSKGGVVEAADGVLAQAVEQDGVAGLVAVEAAGNAERVAQAAARLDVEVEEARGEARRQLQAQQVAQDVLKELVYLVLEAPARRAPGEGRAEGEPSRRGAGARAHQVSRNIQTL